MMLSKLVRRCQENSYALMQVIDFLKEQNKDNRSKENFIIEELEGWKEWQEMDATEFGINILKYGDIDWRTPEEKLANPNEDLEVDELISGALKQAARDEGLDFFDDMMKEDNDDFFNFED